MNTLLSIFNFVVILCEVLIIFNLLIVVHELGHFLAARWRGLVVEKFAIWFGKPIWSKTINGVEYRLGCIPAGGFVALPQMAPMEKLEGESKQSRESLPPISPLDKIIVAFAGPLFSFGLAIVFAVIVWGIGRPVSEADSTTVIGFVEDGSPAQKAGLQAGDKILEVDGHPVKRFAGMVNSVQWFVIRSEGETIPFKVEREGQELTFNANWIKEQRRGWNRAGLRQVLIAPKMTPIVGEVEPGSPAARAGLQPKDIIRAVNGEPIYNPRALSEIISKAPENPVLLSVERAGQTLQISAQPEIMSAEEGVKRPRIGVAWDEGELQLIYPTPQQQIADSASTMFNMIGALFSPKSDVKAQHFSGPVGIMRLYYLMFQNEQGWRMALWFSVLFNINLALLNMLPLPVLDGGHITLAIVEGIIRRPVNQKLVETISTLCAALLMAFMLYVTFYDVQDLPWKKWGKKPGTEQVAPTK